MVMREAVHVVVPSKVVSFQQQEQFSPYCVDVSEPTNVFQYLLPAAILPVDSSQLTDIVGVYIKTMVTDRPDGMYTTVVCDEGGDVLGACI